MYFVQNSILYFLTCSCEILDFFVQRLYIVFYWSYILSWSTYDKNGAQAEFQDNHTHIFKYWSRQNETRNC